MLRMGYDEKDAKKIAHTLLAEQAMYCGGRHVYIPRGDRFRQAVRDIDLFNDWHNRGIVPDELTIKYKLSTQHVSHHQRTAGYSYEAGAAGIILVLGNEWV